MRAAVQSALEVSQVEPEQIRRLLIGEALHVPGSRAAERDELDKAPTLVAGTT